MVSYGGQTDLIDLVFEGQVPEDALPSTAPWRLGARSTRKRASQRGHAAEDIAERGQIQSSLISFTSYVNP